jgi:hypothetical protein
MKKLLLILLFALFGWTKTTAQCLCDFQVEMVQDPIDSCYFDVLFCNNFGPTCNLAATYGPLTISSGGNPLASATMAAVSSTNPGIVSAALQGSTQAVFSSNFAPLGPNCSPAFNVGRICLDQVPNGVVEFSAWIGQPGGPCNIPLITSQFAAPTLCGPQAGLFEKICGDDFENRPTAVKAFGDGLYVAGYRAATNVEYGTFKKYDLFTGALVWEKELTEQSRIVDFEYDAANDEFLLVGWTSPLSASVNNRSILLKLDDTGNLVPGCTKLYDQNGREGFTRIILHPNPVDPNYPYYILGRKNPISTPSSSDVVVLYNVNASCTVNWSVEYAYSTNPTDDEFFLGLFPYGTHLIMTGLVTNNDGALLLINGANGSVLNSVRYPLAMDIYNGIEVPGGMVVIVGENFAANEAFIMVVNPFDPNPFSTAGGNQPSLQFPNIKNFKDIWRDRYGKLYVIGENKNSMLGKNYQVVHKLDLFTHAGFFSLTVDWAKYLEDLLNLELNYANGVISVTPAHDRIFYADSRLKVIPLFGNRDMLVGSYDLSLVSACDFLFPFPTNPLNLTTIPISISNFNFPEPAFISAQVLGLNSCCTDFCNSSPCTASFTYVLKDCFNVDFIASSSTCISGTYSYDWDFGDGSPVVSTNNPTISQMFPCSGGTYTVCLTITDPLGCVATVCNTVNVINCQNCILPTGTLTCNANDFDAFDFTITLTHIIPFTVCSYTVTSLTPGVVLSNISQSFATITGTATLTVCPIPAFLNLDIAANCACPAPGGGSYNCNVLVTIATQCCKEIAVPQAISCEDDAVLDVPIAFFGTPCNISQVTWYVQPKPANGICPTTYWGGKPYQDNLTSALEPLHLYPAQMTGDVCVYAEVRMNDGPCTLLVSSIVCVELCAPATCILQSDQEYCFTGVPVPVSPLTLALNSPTNACFSTIQWCDPAGNPVQQGGVSYTPPPLSMSNPLVDCYEDFFYTVKITDYCGTRECKARIRLYSDDAPKGTLQVLPYEANTLCPLEDITLNFTPGCDSDDPKTWEWFTRPCDPGAGPASPVQGAGVMSNNWFTNMLLTSVYYFVETQNGVCPIDSVELLLEVKEPLSIILFDAIPDPCVEQQVDLSIAWKPCTLSGCQVGTPCSTQCSHTVEWYKDCTIIGTTHEPPGVTSSMFTYPFLPLEGNYFAVVKDDCCPDNRDTSHVLTILPSCEPVIAGPCFICENEQVVLMDMSAIPPATPCPYFCSYVWSTSDGNIVGSSIGSSITVDATGTYNLTTSCILNGQICVKSTALSLIKCLRAVAGVQDCGLVSVKDLLPPELSPVRVFPNPTSIGVTIEWKLPSSRESLLFIIDATGRILVKVEMPANITQFYADLSEFVPGLYFIKIQSEDKVYEVAKVVKQ